MDVTGKYGWKDLRRDADGFYFKEKVMPEAPQLPLYKCHKEVRAAKITEIRDDGTLVFGDIGQEHRPAPTWMNHHHPEVDGYFVCYLGDNYESYSPAAAFEGGYTRADA